MNPNYLSLLVAVLMLLFLYFLKKKNVSFGNRVLIGMVLGVVIGLVFKKNIQSVQPIGQIYVSLIKMLVIPLVVPTIISSITSLDSTEKLKKVGTKTLVWLLSTTAVAAIIGVVVALAMDPGAGIKFAKDASFKAREIPTFAKVLLDMVPSNPVSDMANAKIIPVIVFSIIIAVAMTIEGAINPEVVKPVKSFFNSFSRIMFRVTDMILEITPYGVLGLMASVTGQYGIATLLPLGKMILAVYIACILQVALVHGSLLAFVVKVNPITFFKKIYEAQVVAFTTRSSYGTLPVTIKCLTHKVKISDRVASFVAPMGATMGMNGCGGLYPAIAAIFVARVFDVPMTITGYILLVVVTTIASIGTAGVPGTASIMATVVMAGMGLPIEGIAMLMGVDTIIDMARTATNVTGASVVSLLVANSEGEFDREGFNKEETKEFKVSA
ncbi:dicarboxylate/amino acid:cation symporter [Clostridium sp. CX1]|uniref:Dicarboxylate/amino acid:cation symporter n=1 Tax=Clostridium tanneri TaxID=3037988 RepID=A0ABU4JRT3_9CLOT|nr:MULTISPECIES: dicarboxylate/amino acid:cation symporter [unclassified Clostridium]MCT8977785.1 dicarboxylate/amino acid:cation symporter [Clostridium sp. CX1]MDW8800860.1 dicarboxylate/amino acid:cation symporter [Clostridium sp. A1-XYC3]